MASMNPNSIPWLHLLPPCLTPQKASLDSSMASMNRTPGILYHQSISNTPHNNLLLINHHNKMSWGTPPTTSSRASPAATSATSASWTACSCCHDEGCCGDRRLHALVVSTFLLSMHIYHYIYSDESLSSHPVFCLMNQQVRYSIWKSVICVP
jgi:hypothetical protein